MTRDQITAQVMSRLNLSSTTAQSRINDEVQERYNWVLDQIGVAVATRGTATASTVASTRTVTFTLQRLDQLYLTTALAALEQVEYDILRREATASANPAAGDRYAIQLVTGTTVTVMLQNTPTGIVSLTADGLLATTALVGSSIPAIPESFHDALVYGCMGIELRKMEKQALADVNDAIFEKRLSALSAYLRVTPN